MNNDEKKVGSERPFENTDDLFYSASNIRHLENIVSDIKEGKAHFAEHDLIEEDEPTEDEVRAIREAEADTGPTIPHEEIDWN